MHDIFHLSLSVNDLDSSRKFYEDICGARIGRVRDRWLDVWLFGAQLTLYHRPAAVIPAVYRNGHHFGATIEQSAWELFADSLKCKKVNFKFSPRRDDATGVSKMMFLDPDGHLIEVKAYDAPEQYLQIPA